MKLGYYITERSQTTLCIPQIFKMQYLHNSNGPIAFKFYTEVKYLKL